MDNLFFTATLVACIMTPGTHVFAATPPATIFVEDTASGLKFDHVNGMTGDYQFPEMAGQGAAFLDYDNDGDLDIYLVQGGNLDPAKSRADFLFPVARGLQLRDRLLRNDLKTVGGKTELRFTDVTEASGIEGRGYGMGVATGDFDNDGWTDVYVTNFGDNQLLRNRGDGTFEDVTRKARVRDEAWSTSASFFDYDRDGWLDLFVARYVEYSVAKNVTCYAKSSRRDYCGPSGFKGLPDLLFRNLGDGTFAEVTSKVGISGAPGPALGVVAADFNGDRWIDLYVTNDGKANRLWLNTQKGTFVDDALLAGAAVNRQGQPEASMGVAAGDFDGDGDEDLFMTHLTAESNTLYVNDGTGLFTDRSVETSLAAASLPFTAFGTSWLDYDGDGLLDLVILNGAVKVLEPRVRAGDTYPLDQANQLFHNLGRSFEDATAKAGPAFERVEVSRGVAVGDVDNDGDPDLLVLNNNGPARLLRNAIGQDQPWLGLRLADKKNGRDLLGARVGLLRSGAPTIWRRAHSDGSYCSAGDPRVLFGLGGGAQISGVQVLWPDGTEETFQAPPVGRYTTLLQGQGRSATEKATAEKAAAKKATVGALRNPLGPLGASGNLLAVVLGASAAAPSGDLEAIPFPPLEAFEKSVRAQIGRTQDLLQQMLEAGSGPPEDLGDLFGELGQIYHAYELAEPARACYSNARRLDSLDRRWPYYEGLLLQQQGQLAEAAQRYRAIVAQEPQNISVRIYLAETLIGRNLSKEAEALLDAVLKDAPKSTSARALMGELALAAGRPQEAVELLSAVLEEVPEANRLHYPLAQAYRDLGLQDKAREHLALRGPVGLRPPDPMMQVLVEIPQGERVNLLQGRLAFKMGRYGEAVDAFQDAVHAKPDSARARVNLATALGQTGAIGRAMEEYREALRLESDNTTAHFNLGFLHSRRGELEDARKHLEAAVAAEPTDAGAHRELAAVNRRSGRREEALEGYIRARKLEPRDEAAWLGEAGVLVELERHGAAITSLEEALLELPDQGRLRHALARLLATAPELSLRDGQRALDLGQSVFSAVQSLRHAETVAMALAELGRCEEAAAWQSRLIQEAERIGATDQLQKLRDALSLYEQGKTCRYRSYGSDSISDSGDVTSSPLTLN